MTRPRHLNILLLALALSATFHGTSLFGSTFLELNLHDLTTKSSDVVTGTVIDQWTEADAQGRYITTYSRVKVESPVRGKLAESQEMVIAQPGGTIGKGEAAVTQVVHGVALLRRNENLLLFLKSNGQNQPYKLTGFNQGVYRLHRGATGTMLATPKQAFGHKVLTRNQSGKFVETSGASEAIPLSSLIEQIKSVPNP